VNGPKCYGQAVAYDDLKALPATAPVVIAGLSRVAGAVAVEEHAGVPAAHLRLLDLVRQIVGLAQRFPVVLLRCPPLLAAGGGDAGHGLK
jgi:hypothetical protein